MKNKKGQITDYPVLTFIVLAIVIIMLAPVFLKVLRGIQTNLSPVYGNMTFGQNSQQAVNYVIGSTVNIWDEAMVLLFFILIFVMIISAVFIDTHPFWIFLYILISFVVILLSPDIIESMTSIYDASLFGEEVAYLPYLDFIRLHFAEFIVGLMVFTGIIIYAKVSFFKNLGGQKY